MVKCRVVPAFRLVAGFAGLRQIHNLVIRPLGCFVVLFVTGEAVCIEFVAKLVASGAGSGSVRTGQGKPFVMIFGRFQPFIPPHNRVALFTIVPLLALVYIRMTVGALLCDIRKDEVCVAEGAICRRMHPSEGVACFLMIEIGRRTDGGPVGARMTVQTVETQGAMRVVRLSLHLLLAKTRIA